MKNKTSKWGLTKVPCRAPSPNSEKHKRKSRRSGDGRHPRGRGPTKGGGGAERGKGASGRATDDTHTARPPRNLNRHFKLALLTSACVRPGVFPRADTAPSNDQLLALRHTQAAEPKLRPALRSPAGIAVSRADTSALLDPVETGACEALPGSLPAVQGAQLHLCPARPDREPGPAKPCLGSIQPCTA